MTYEDKASYDSTPSSYDSMHTHTHTHSHTHVRRCGAVHHVVWVPAILWRFHSGALQADPQRRVCVPLAVLGRCVGRGVRNTLQHTATHCNTLQHAATCCNTYWVSISDEVFVTHCNTLQRTATHCNTLPHAATYYNTLQHTATHCNTLRHTATHIHDSLDSADDACIHTNMHAHIHAYIKTYMQTCIHAYVHVCIHACVHAKNIYIHTCIHANIQDRHAKHSGRAPCSQGAPHCNTLQDTASHRNTMLHIHIRTNCTYIFLLKCTIHPTYIGKGPCSQVARHCNTLQHTATHCNTYEFSLKCTIFTAYVCT